MRASAMRTKLLTIGLCLCATASASADVVMLRNGGRIRGRLQSDADGSVVVVETLLGGTVAVDQSAIENIERRSLLLEEYETRARDVADEVQPRWELAEWCKANGLREAREEQLSLLLNIDPDHEDARRILGHVRHNGQWLTRDEWMTSRGYVRHNGKYVTQQERDLLLKSEEERAAETAWYPKVRQWFNWATGRNAQRAADGRAQLAGLTDPDAAPAVVNFLGGHRDAEVRLLCVRLLGQMAGPKPVEPLVAKSLYDSSHDVRMAARGAIRADQYPLAMEFYVPELKSDSNEIVQRAAVAIRDMGDKTAVPYLIGALVTHHRWKVEVPQAPTVSVIGGEGSWLPPEIEGLARTGQLPYGAIVIPPATQARTTRTVTIKGDVKNAEVLAALKRITGQDFGYNKRAWEIWWQTQANS